MISKYILIRYREKGKWECVQNKRDCYYDSETLRIAPINAIYTIIISIVIFVIYILGFLKNDQYLNWSI